MKLSKILSKRALSLLIVGLFVFTAFAVIQSGGTDTGSIHSVSPTSIIPYTTTSNGLTYTVESNGTYLWNGHYLRDPPVPYPKVPTIAPDGLPYGAVGPVGAQGHVGPYTFTKGTPVMTGVHPSTVDGAPTWINTNTFWGNETVDLVGNVSIQAGVTLTIYDSVIDYTYESSGPWSYGINTNYSSSNFAHLISEDGTIFTQSATGYSYFIGNNWGPSNADYIIISNTTLYFNSTLPTYYTPGFNAKPLANYLNYSAVYEAGLKSYPTYNYIEAFGFTSASTSEETAVNFASHDFFHNAFIAMDSSNSTFINTSEVVRFQDGPSNSITYNTYEWNNGSRPFMGGSSDIANQADLNFTHNLIKNWNVSSYATLGITGNQTNILSNYFRVYNNTFENIWTGDPTGHTGGSNIANTLVQGTDENTYFIHNTLQNITYYDRSGYAETFYVGNYFYTNGTNFPATTPAMGNATFEYNKVADLRSTYQEESGPFAASARNVTFSYNLEINWTAPVTASYQTPMSVGDYGTQIYTYIDNYQTNLPHSYHAILPHSKQLFTDNWIVNMSGPLMVNQIYSDGATVSGNIAINLNRSDAIATTGNAQGMNIYESNDTIYGAYNTSIAFGEPFGGESYNTTYSSIIGYDIGMHSYPLVIYHSYDHVKDQSGAISIINNRDTQASIGAYPAGPWAPNYTVVDFSDSSFTTINLTALNTSMYQQVPIKGSDFYINSSDTYLPQTLLSSAYNFSSTNPSFLNLTGYLGIYAGQTYTLNASNIKNEASLPIYYSGNEIADIPASSAHYNFTALGVDKYSISTPSSKSDPVKLYFQGIADALYDVEMISNGTVVSTFTEYANATGVLNTTYNPSTMPLDPIFTVAYVGSVASPPVVPPLVPIVPHVLFGIPYLNVIVLFGGIALASEEFFRTQTKGKEKKYSYTGIFVGIMIAGIGLMSVL